MNRIRNRSFSHSALMALQVLMLFVALVLVTPGVARADDGLQEPAYSLYDARISGIGESYDYTGEAICPEPTVMLDGTLLTEGTDYELSYENNVEVGTAWVSVTGVGGYWGATGMSFQIVKPLAVSGDAERACLVGDSFSLASYHYHNPGANSDSPSAPGDGGGSASTGGGGVLLVDGVNFKNTEGSLSLEYGCISGGVTWAITEGSGLASIEGDVLKLNAPGVVKLKATVTNSNADSQITEESAEVVLNVSSTFSLSWHRAVMIGSRSFTLEVTGSAAAAGVSWESSDPTVVSVDESGKVTSLAKGTATITARAADGSKSDSCEVTVSNPVTKIGFASTLLEANVGEQLVLAPVYQGELPGEVDEVNATWTTSNDEVVSVNGDGSSATLDARAKGSVTIQLRVSSGGGSLEDSNGGIAWTSRVTSQYLMVSVVECEAATLDVSQDGWTYGGVAKQPSFALPEGTTQTKMSYEGITRSGVAYGPGSDVPSDAGSYTVYVTCETSSKSYQGHASFTIAPADISSAAVTLSGNNGLVYDGETKTVEVTGVLLNGNNVVDSCDISGLSATGAGTHAVRVSARDDSNYAGIVSASFSIAKARSSISGLSAEAISYGQSLADSELAGVAAPEGTFAWKDASLHPSVSDSNKTSYAVVFTPKDAANYETVEVSTVLEVKKAEQPSNAPTNATVAYATTCLNDVALPNGWAWREGSRELSLGANKVTAVYVADDADCYETTSVELTVTRSACAHPANRRETRGAYAATAASTGYTGDEYCKDCGELVASGRVIGIMGETSNAKASTNDVSSSGSRGDGANSGAPSTSSSANSAAKSIPQTGDTPWAIPVMLALFGACLIGVAFALVRR